MTTLTVQSRGAIREGIREDLARRRLLPGQAALAVVAFALVDLVTLTLGNPGDTLRWWTALFASVVAFALAAATWTEGLLRRDALISAERNRRTVESETRSISTPVADDAAHPPRRALAGSVDTTAPPRALCAGGSASTSTPPEGARP